MPLMNDNPNTSSDEPLLDWRDMVGLNDSWVKLKALVDSDRLPQVILFDGRAGIGKRKLMAKLVASLFCEDACGRCSDCKALQSRSFEEVLWVDGSKGQLKIEAAEAIQEHLSLRSSSAFMNSGSSFARAQRVVVVSDIENMGVRAANRLLKTIEEPPAGSRIILSTSRLFKVIDTIRSRAVKWHVTPPPISASLAWLQDKIAVYGLGPVTEQKLAEMLRRNGLAPGLVLSALERYQQTNWLEESDHIFDALIKESSFEHISSVASNLVRQHKLGIAEFIDHVELALHRSYRRSLGLDQTGDASVKGSNPFSIGQVRRKRKALSEARRLAVGGKIPLNIQLLAEVLSQAK